MIKISFFLLLFFTSFKAFSEVKNAEVEYLTPEEKALLENHLEEIKPPSLCDRTEEFFKNRPKENQLFKVDNILIDKKRRFMHLLKQGQSIASYRIALGKNPVGNKELEGDQKTPEGLYFFELKNRKSKYHLSLGINYPNKQDRAKAQQDGLSDIGKDIMVHGLPNNWIIKNLIRHPKDWTKGCIAVTDREIEEIFSVVDLGTLIEICP